MRRNSGLLLATMLVACTPTLSQPRGDVHLQAMADATRAYHHGRFDVAATTYARAAEHAERRVDRDEALYREAKSLARIGENERALALFDQIASTRPVSRRTGRAMYDAARLRLRMGREAEAVAAFKRVVLEFPDHGVSSRALRRVIRATSDLAALRAWLNEAYGAVGTHDIGDDILVELAEMHYRAGDIVAARVGYERVIEEHPYPHGQRWDDALMRLADLDLELNEPAAAIAHLEQMLSVHESTTIPGSYTLPRFPEGMLRLGILYRDQAHDMGNAARTFQRLYNELEYSTLRDDAMLEEAKMWIDANERDRGCALLHRIVDEFEVGRAKRNAAELLAASCAASN